jgi:hypothetical protein
MGSVPAPAVIVLTTAEPDKFVAFGDTNALEAKVLVEAHDSEFRTAYWKPMGDSAILVVPFSVGLFGLGYEIHTDGDSLVGRGAAAA